MFQLAIYPWVHACKFNGKTWDEQYMEKEHRSQQEESGLSKEDYLSLMNKRNNFPGLPLVNYSTQYGLSCFEGLKAFPQPDGQLKMFRPDRNCTRMAKSMKGLCMPPVPEELLLNAMKELVRRNHKLGFTPSYNKEWEIDSWQNSETMYLRPFSYTEEGIGVNLSQLPWVVTICTTVASYYKLGKNNVITSKRIRATPNGTGNIKAAANYVVSALAKAEAIGMGYMETLFLDSESRQNIEEGSSSNFFALLSDGTIVTPALGDTILEGITRESVMVLARDAGYTVEERIVPLQEVMDNAVECFLTGTAVGIAPLGSITHDNREKKLDSLHPDSVSHQLLKQLKGLQFGFVEDRYGWMLDVLFD